MHVCLNVLCCNNCYLFINISRYKIQTKNVSNKENNILAYENLRYDSVFFCVGFDVVLLSKCFL